LDLIVAEQGQRHRWVLHAYVLMTNHHHLIVETPVPTLSRGMIQFRHSRA
jgi:REP element-mobilizing transposase RayT